MKEFFGSLFSGIFTGATAGATGGLTVYAQIAVWVFKHLPIILVSCALAITLCLYKCERSSVNSLKSEKTKLENTVKEKDQTIVELQADVQQSKDLIAKKTAELQITQAALSRFDNLQKQSEQQQKDASNILDKYQKESDIAKKQELEAEYWNKVLGLKKLAPKEKNDKVKNITLRSAIKPKAKRSVR